MDIKTPDFRYRQKNRLLKRSQYLALTAAQKPFKVKAGPLLVFIKPNELGYNRLGTSVSKKVVNQAVKRNSLKRRLKEFFRLNQGQWPQGYDMVIIARQGSRDLSWAALVNNLSGLTRRSWP